jgi:hypothetical protein
VYTWSVLVKQWGSGELCIGIADPLASVDAFFTSEYARVYLNKGWKVSNLGSEIYQGAEEFGQGD